jgi:hypothetical protein
MWREGSVDGEEAESIDRSGPLNKEASHPEEWGGGGGGQKKASCASIVIIGKKKENSSCWRRITRPT